MPVSMATETHLRLVVGDIPLKFTTDVMQYRSFEDSSNKLNELEDKKQFKPQIVKKNAVVFALLHVAAVYGFYVGLTQGKWQTMVFAWCLHQFSGQLGVIAGAHRLWSHRSYKARLPLRIVLMIAQTIALQNSIYDWCRDHRVHHKFSETDADPHNSKRGFFFSHVGWLMTKKHPMVISQGKKLDFSDLLADPVVAFQKRFYIPMAFVLSIVLPTMIPVWFWSESVWVSYFFPTIARYAFTLNITWLVNSAAHRFGNKPYDKKIGPTENRLVVFYTGGEGWHNYHHSFPQDYRASELGWSRFNLTANCIDLWGWLGLAYDLKTVSKEMAWNRAKKLGDGTHEKKLDWVDEQTDNRTNG